MVLNIICISVIVRLVSITPVMLNLIDYPTPKVDRSNENDRDNKNKNNGKDDNKDI